MFPKRNLALEYHENSKELPRNLPFNPKIQYKIYPSAPNIELTTITLDKQIEANEFVKILLSRKSTRNFKQDGINLKELSQLLPLSFGLRNQNSSSDIFRTYASAGARYPIEVYPVVLRSNDMELGIYHYNVVDNALEFIKSGDYSQKIYGFYEDQQFVSSAPCIIFFSMVFERTMQKYGERGYRFIYLDAGHMSQNLYLMAEYLGLGVVALGAGMKSDDKIDNLIGLTHTIENTFLGFAVGLPGIVE